MVFDGATKTEEGFETQLIDKLGEWVEYYDYTETYDDDGYLTARTEPTQVRTKIILATFTQKDITEYDLGNIGVDDHKAFIQNNITPAERDEIERADGERYEIVKILHEHAIRGTKTFYSVQIRRRKNTS